MTKSSFARGVATDFGCAAMNAFSSSIRSGSCLVSVSSTSSLSSSEFSGVLTTLGVGLRAGPGERAGRRLFSAISFAVVGDGCAGVSDGVVIAFVGEGFSVDSGDASGEGLAGGGVSEGCALGEDITEGEVSGRGVSVAAGAAFGLAAGVSLGDGRGVCKGVELAAAVSTGGGATA